MKSTSAEESMSKDSKFHWIGVMRWLVPLLRAPLGHRLPGSHRGICIDLAKAVCDLSVAKVKP